MTLQILHLEDNTDDVDLVRRSLKRHGLDCSIHAVSTGPAYLAALEQRKFDVILSDSGLPGYDGQAACIAAHERYPAIPFIVVSGSVAPDPFAKPPVKGAAAHLAKSEVKQLGGIIQSALKKQPALQAAPRQAHASPYIAEMKHLVSVVQRLSLARDLDTIMSIVRRAARELTGADGATFVLRDGERCFYADEDAIEPLWKGQRFPLTACVSGWAMLNRQPAVIPDIYADPRVPHDAYRPTFVKSMVMMPIRTVAPVGAIGVYWASIHQATPEETELLQALADSTSIAIEAVDLFSNLERRVAERTEEVHRRSAELEVVNHELEAFSYSVAHDLRSPLIAIDGFRQELLENCGETLDAENRENLGRIGISVRRMYGLIEDLLKLSKITQTPMQQDSVNLAGIAREIAMQLRERDPKRRLEFVIPETLTVRGDAGLLRVALENLMGNAWKFSARRPAARIEVGMENDTGEAWYFVRDNGAGFDARYASKLFTPFTRLHTQAEFPGTGIGLAIVQRVIHRHSGKIWAQGEPDRGATFYFTLPSLLPAN